MASPTFFPEGSTPQRSDTRWRILQKINGALADGAAGGGGTGSQEIYPAGTAAPDDTTKPALRFTAQPPAPMEQWDTVSQTWV